MIKKRSKPVNRRRSGGRSKWHELDVTVRSPVERRRRNQRIIAWVCRIVIVGSILGGGFYGIREGLRRFLWENPDYRLAEIRVRTDGILTRDDILNIVKVKEGDNIFAVNLSRTKTSLQKVPEVDQVEIQRIPPNRINITVLERKGVARITIPGAVEESALLLDPHGVPFQPRKKPDGFYHLPEITGIKLDVLEPGQPTSRPEIKAALSLLDLNADNPRYEILAIDVSRGWCMSVTDRSHIQATFGFSNIDRQLDRLRRLLVYTDTNRRNIQTVNLMVDKNIPVVFAPLGGGPAPEVDEVKPKVVQSAVKPTAVATKAKKSEPTKPSAPATKSSSTSSKKPSSTKSEPKSSPVFKAEPFNASKTPTKKRDG